MDIGEIDKNITFTMCNPPFFNDVWDDNKDNDYVLKKSNGNKANAIETVFEGGEVAFVRQMINESILLKEKIIIFTTMLGKKSSLKVLKDDLKILKETIPEISITTTEFCQGKRKRWGLVWTFNSYIDLNNAPRIKQSKNKKANLLTHNLSHTMSQSEYKLLSVCERIQFLLAEELKMPFMEVVRDSKYAFEIVVMSNTNTWSHQRRKRRAEQRQQNSDTSMESMEMSIDKVTICTENPNKRHIDSFDSSFEEGSEVKRIREVKLLVPNEQDKYLLHCSVTVKLTNLTLVFQMQTLEKSDNKQATYQLFQYLKNKLV